MSFLLQQRTNIQQREPLFNYNKDNRQQRTFLYLAFIFYERKNFILTVEIHIFLHTLLQL